VIHTNSEDTGSGLVLLNMALQAIAADRGAVDIFRRHNLTSGSADHKIVQVPEDILAAIKNTIKADRPSSSFSIAVGESRYRCRTYVIQSESISLKGGMVALHLDAETDTRDPLSAVMAAYHLTEREGEALRGIALGLSTKEMADRMRISPNTVKSFVRLIMIKLNVTSRAAIMVKLLEKNGH
jgi:DNA-binding CsgD family transcriptional regulator